MIASDDGVIDLVLKRGNHIPNLVGCVTLYLKMLSWSIFASQLESQWLKFSAGLVR